MRNFGAPDTVIAQYEYWTIMLRPAQVTLGALILAANSDVQAFSDLHQESFTELKSVTAALEQALTRTFGYDKLNYLMLMMVDPDVHFHVIPRYSETKSFAELDFQDAGWPGPPKLDQINSTNAEINAKICAELANNWN